MFSMLIWIDGVVEEMPGTDGSQAAILDISDLHVHFQTYEGVARVVNGVSMRVNPGETVALVGETGCGKSVTSKAVLGLLPGSARVVKGRIHFKGEDLMTLTGRDMQRRIRGKGISMVFQDPMTALNPVFTVGEQMVNVLVWQGRQRFGILDAAYLRLERDRIPNARRRAVEMLDTVRLPSPKEIFDKYPVELSGGMRQRVLIALALVSQPELLMADEPGTALDVSIQDQILELLRELVFTFGTSVLYITHDLGVARNISDRINVMYAGELVESAQTVEMFGRQYHPYSRGLLASVPKLTGRMGEGIGGMIPDYSNPPRGCRFAPRCVDSLPVCEEVHPPWVEVEPGRHAMCHLYADQGGKAGGR